MVKIENVPHKIVLVCRSCMDRQQCVYLVNSDKQATSLLHAIYTHTYPMHNGGVLYAIYVSTVIHVSADLDSDALSDSVRRLSKCMVISVTGNHMRCQVRCVNMWLNR